MLAGIESNALCMLEKTLEKTLDAEIYLDPFSNCLNALTLASQLPVLLVMINYSAMNVASYFSFHLIVFLLFVLCERLCVCPWGMSIWRSEGNAGEG